MDQETVEIINRAAKIIKSGDVRPQHWIYGIGKQWGCGLVRFDKTYPSVHIDQTQLIDIAPVYTWNFSPRSDGELWDAWVIIDGVLWFAVVRDIMYPLGRNNE